MRTTTSSGNSSNGNTGNSCRSENRVYLKVGLEMDSPGNNSKFTGESSVERSLRTGQSR